MEPSDPKQEPSQDAPADDSASVEKRIDRALAPYKDLVPPEDFQFMREMMEVYANSHPDVAALIDSLRKRRQVNRSTSMTGPGLDPSERVGKPQHAASSTPKPKKKANPRGR